MKKLFTTCFVGLIALSYNAVGQSVRTVLAEEFTQASCPPCATQNPTFNALLDANSTKVVAIKYQTSWPGSDPMNANTQSLVGPRVSYYSVSGVPWAAMDGVAQTGSSYSGAPANWSQTKLNTRAAITSPFTLGVTHSFNSTHDSIFITVDIAATGAVTGTLVAHVAIIEKEISFCKAPGTNGEMLFEGVMQMMLPSASGTTLATSWTIGQMQQLTFAAKLPSYIYDKNELAVVSFIQDNATKAVHQAGHSIPQPLTVDARLDCNAVVGIPPVSCGSTLSPTVKFSNQGTTALTSINLNYSVDGTSFPPIPWTGNLAPSASATITIPSLPTTAGTHSLDITISNPNSVTDLNVTYDHLVQSYTVASSVGAALPVEQAFTLSTFPPTNWININADNGYGWTRLSTAGFNGNGCAKINFYSSPTGEIDELWIPNYDFSISGTTTAQIDFDVAYCQYSTQNDKIEVMYSTDCGLNWTTVFNEAGTVLANGNPDTTSSWKPTNPSQWHHKTSLLTGAIGSPSVFIKFKATSAYGNNGYIDNINVTTNLMTSVPQLYNVQEFSVYPNPSSSGLINVQLGLNNSENVTIVVTNPLGAIVKTINLDNISSGIFPVDLSNEAKGTYEVSVRTKDKVLTKRISIVE